MLFIIPKYLLGFVSFNFSATFIKTSLCLSVLAYSPPTTPPVSDEKKEEVTPPTTPPPTEEQKPETTPSEDIGEQETNPNEVKPAE